MTQILSDQELFTALQVMLRSAVEICRQSAEDISPVPASRALVDVLVQASLLPEFDTPIFSALKLLDVAWHEISPNSIDFAGMEVLCTALADLLEVQRGR